MKRAPKEPRPGSLALGWGWLWLWVAISSGLLAKNKAPAPFTHEAVLHSVTMHESTPDWQALEERYQVELREREIELLRAENALKESRLVAEQNRNALLEIQHANAVTMRWVMSGLAGLLFILVALLWRLRQIDKKSAHIERGLNAALRESHRQLLESHAQLKRADEQRQTLLRITTHDLKNPLSALTMLLETIAENQRSQPDATDEELQDLLRSCHRDLEHANDVVDRLVRAQFGENLLEQIDPRPVRVAEIADQALALSERAATQKNIVLTADTDEDLRALADTQALREVLDNLVSNAVKYSEPGGRVEVLAFAGNAHATILVRDAGPGFAEEDFSRIFQPFSRLTAQPTGGESSSGLGLSIVHELTRAMGGTVQARNRPRGGAELEVCLRFPTDTPQERENRKL